MMKPMTVVGMMLVVAGCAGSAEESTSSLTSAVSTSSEADERGHRGPPPEAFTACEGKAAGDACTVTTPHGDELAGTCATPPEDTRLACRPSHMPEGGPPPPPRDRDGDGDGRRGPPSRNAEGNQACSGQEAS